MARYHFAMDTVGERIRAAREAAGYSTVADAARAFGIHKQNLADHEANRRGVSPEQAQRYGRVFRVDPAWLLLGGANRRPRGSGLVPVIGRVGADNDGNVILSTGQASGDQAPIPPGGTSRAAALEVTGHSMHGVADDGALLYFEEQHSIPTRDHIGRVVVCELETGEVLVKRLLKGDDKDLWDLESVAGPTLEGRRLKWVANITAIVPPPISQQIIERAGAISAA
jgi:transcriptional regulator with XRE-family HTH domain